MFGKKKSPREILRGEKKIRVCGMNFTIRKINPILDFEGSNLPSIFTDKKPTTEKNAHLKPEEKIKNLQKDMFSILRAGIVDPEIGPPGCKEHIGVDDLFRDPSMGVKLYLEILNHSSVAMKGIKSVFFWIARKFLFSMLCVDGTVNDLAIYYGKKEKPA